MHVCVRFSGFCLLAGSTFLSMFGNTTKIPSFACTVVWWLLNLLCKSAAGFFLLQYGYLWTRPHQPLLPTSLADSLAGENKVRMNTENEFVFYPLGRLPLPGLGLAVWLVSGRILCFLVLIVLSLFWEQKGFGFCWCQSDSFLEAINSIKKIKSLWCALP